MRGVERAPGAAPEPPERGTRVPEAPPVRHTLHDPTTCPACAHELDTAATLADAVARDRADRWGYSQTLDARELLRWVRREATDRNLVLDVTAVLRTVNVHPGRPAHPLTTSPPPPTAAPAAAPIADQPPPVANDGPHIADLVLADLAERKRIGVERYGVALQPHNGRDALIDAYQEALDLTLYLRQAIEERAPACTTPKVDQPTRCLSCGDLL